MTSSYRGFKRQRLDKVDIKLIFDSDSEVTEKNLNATDDAENDMTEQAPVLPHQGVYKQNLVMDQSAGGGHNNTDDTSDDEVMGY
jgi:hypothetical protein